MPKTPVRGSPSRCLSAERFIKKIEKKTYLLIVVFIKKKKRQNYAFLRLSKDIFSKSFGKDLDLILIGVVEVTTILVGLNGKC
jgi:hypothetical protein